MSDANMFVHQFDYLCKARETLLGWVRTQPAEVYNRPFPFGMGSIRLTLVHTAGAQWNYTQRLGSGEDPVPSDSPFTKEKQPEFEAFATEWARLDPRTREVLAGIGDGSRTIAYVSRMANPPVRIRTTAGGIASQLLFHEVHHRAQVMAMLRQVGVAAQNLDYGILMSERTPVS